MKRKSQEYRVRIAWTGNRGTGTSAYRAYDRNWDLESPGKPVVHCSNDPALGGDPSRYNPEDMLVTAIASCHMLWYLHLCSVAGIIVTSYSDEPVGVMGLQIDGAGQFEKVTLHPRIALKPGSNVEKARALHGEIHKYCFVSRSVNFPVLHEPIIIIGPA